MAAKYRGSPEASISDVLGSNELVGKTLQFKGLRMKNPPLHDSYDTQRANAFKPQLI